MTVSIDGSPAARLTSLCYYPTPPGRRPADFGLDETTKWLGLVRSKTNIAMKNEVLAKLICPNICCVIQSAYEFGIEPIFATETEHDSKMILKFHF